MPARSIRRALVFAALLSAAVLVESPARAQDGPADVARRELIAQAEAAAAAGDHAQAVLLGERVSQIRVNPSVQFFLAREHLALDHPVEALRYAGACARAAEADAGLHNRDVVLAACRGVEADAGQRVARVVVHVPAASTPGLAVRVQQAALASALYDLPYPVAPGVVVIEATAPGRLPFRRELLLTARETARVDVRLDRPLVATPSPRGYSIGPWVVAGAGVVAFALAGVFFGLASSAQSDRDAADAAAMDDRAAALDADYASWIRGTNASIVVGSALLAGGVAWLLVDRLGHRESRRSALRWNAAPVANGLTLGLDGRF